MGEMQDLFDSICDQCEFADMCTETPMFADIRILVAVMKKKMSKACHALARIKAGKVKGNIARRYCYHEI